MRQGRDREIAEILRLRRAAEVGRLMLGELNEPLRPMPQSNLVATNRRELPLKEFVSRVGQPRPGVLKGAPAHATIHLSLWGLQTEYPEMHLSRDLALAYNDALDAQREAQAYEGTSWKRAKDGAIRGPLGATLRRAKYSMRACLLSCFNLTEAFINGIAWEFVQGAKRAVLSKTQQDLLEGRASLIDRLVQVPAIVRGQTPGPLARDRDPLLTFRELVKPVRDSIVHASPFSAPERFGGYDKLARVYELELPTVTTSVDLTLRVIGTIHQFLNAGRQPPEWLPVRQDDGHLVPP